jgi:hypothetical protein
MNEQTQPPKQSRSPAYPAVPLSTAIESARKLWDAQRKQEAHFDSVLKALGYSARSGSSLRAIAALGHYGLIDVGGDRDNRKIRLSEQALDILHLAETDERRRKALKSAALAPKIYSALWERYGPNLPDDALIRPFLIRDKGYNDAVVDNLITNYRLTLEFAKLDKIDEDVRREEQSDKRQKSAEDEIAKGAGRGSDTMTLDQELPILVGASNRVARIPFPMTEDDFELLIGTLNLWKKKLVSPKSDSDAKSQASNASDED